jgi:hypothetical protein
MLSSSRTMLSLAFAFAACGGERAPIVSEKGEVVKAEAKDADFDQRMADRKAKREADEKAKGEADKAKSEALDAITVVPAKKPKKIEAACEAVGAAQDRSCSGSTPARCSPNGTPTRARC